jgi:hypothetical protein
MTFLILASVTCVLALIPACLWHRNSLAYAPPPKPGADGELPAVSVLIPARNEARSIRAAVAAALASQDVTLEVIVLDDHSEDETASIVRQMAAQDPRVRLETAPALPPGWCGKQHACAALARLAAHPQLAFVDADVRLAPDALAHLAAFLRSGGADLISGVPEQETGTFAERLVIPLIHFLLLGFLPLHRMRASRHPAYGSGCGQLFMARREAYEKMGGHAAIRTSLHDGLTLPRAFRQAGLMTDICDVTQLAACRMYHGFAELWNGLAKNATEGLATPATIVPATVLLLGGQVMPVILFAYGLLAPVSTAGRVLTCLAVVAAYYPRMDACWRFAQSWRGALLHPCRILLLLGIQWYALGRAAMGRPAVWKGRPYVTASTRGQIGIADGN